MREPLAAAPRPGVPALQHGQRPPSPQESSSARPAVPGRFPRLSLPGGPAAARPAQAPPPALRLPRGRSPLHLSPGLRSPLPPGSAGADRGVAGPRLTEAGKEPVPSVGAFAPPALPPRRSLSAAFPRSCRAGGRRAAGPGAAM